VKQSELLAAGVLTATTKKVVNFFAERSASGDLTSGFSDLEVTWLLYCAGAATDTWL